MTHPVIVTIVHHPDDPVGAGIVAAMVGHFDCLGMSRAGVHMRIPVRVRSEALGPGDALRPIVPKAGRLDVVVPVLSAEMDEAAAPWMKLVDDMIAAFAGAPERLFVQAVLLEPEVRMFPALAQWQALAWHTWSGLDGAARARRLMLHLVNSIRRRLSGKAAGDREPIFISHAKADGKEAAERLIAHMQDPRNELKLDTFYDAMQLEAGEDWAQGLAKGAETASLLALVTDAYDTRPWCNQEILWAKEHRRPILMVDVGRKRVGRSFPYAGNVPLIADPMKDPAGMEAVLLELLSEALRCDLFVAAVEARSGGAAIPLPRPPELCDLVYCDRDPDRPLVYPDPPLPAAELALLGRAAGARRVAALSDLP